MSTYFFSVESVHNASVEKSSLLIFIDLFSSFGLAIIKSKPFELWASSDSGSYSGTSIHLSSLDHQPGKLLVEIRSSESKSLMSSKAKRLAEELHCKYKAEFLCSELET